MFNSVIHCGSAEAIGDWQVRRRPDCERVIPYQQQLNEEISHLLETTRCHSLEMDGDIIDQVGPHIREILRICSAVDLEGTELQELNALVGRTVQDHFIELSGGTDTPCPITFAFQRLRRSDRLSGGKRTYEAMQGTNKKTGKLPKKPKLVIDEAAAANLNSGRHSDHNIIHGRPSADDTSSCALVGEEPTAGFATLEMTNSPTSTEPNILQSAETLGEEEGDNRLAVGSVLASPGYNGGGIPDSDLSAITHDDGLAILDEYFPKSATGVGPLDRGLAVEPLMPAARVALPDAPAVQTPSAGPDAEGPRESEMPYPERAVDSVEECDSTSHLESPGSVSTSRNPTRCASYETNATDVDSLNTAIPFTKRAVLDEGSQLLEHVLAALDSPYDDRRDPATSIPGVLDEVHGTSDHELFVRITTSIVENWARCNRLIARSALEMAQERLSEGAQDPSSLSRIDPFQISIIRRDRAKLDHLRHAIACRDWRELSEVELRNILAEPLELMGEFREESDYRSAIKRIEREAADGTMAHLRRMWKETYYWPMVQQRAKMLGPLPSASGRKSLVSPQEKVAARQLIAAIGYGQSRNNIFKWTSYWKLLSDLREKGVTSFLLGRTGEFKNYFFQHAKGLGTVLSWNKIYDLPLRQLRLRIVAEEAGDFSGKSDIEEQEIYNRLHAPQNICWGNHLSIWDEDSRERDDFLANCSLKPTSAKSNIDVLRDGIEGRQDRNMSIYISLVPYTGESGKRAFGKKTASTELLAVAPSVPISPGDFLGIFSGRLRYTDQRPMRAIRGPVLNLWLDYSKVMGKLNKIKVAKDDEAANVCLAWEVVNEVEGEETCQYMRVLVVATRHITPFDHLIRPRPGADISPAYNESP